VWIDYFRGIENAETEWLEYQVERQRLAVTDHILCLIFERLQA